MNKPPLVDVLISTYNHRNFIGQAIESVLAQETDFEYRLSIADDCSDDGTCEIIYEYANRHPERMTVMISPQRVGLQSQERFSIKVMEQLGGKYIALLDGDDYWTSKHKLQKQVDFLEQHPDFAICFHNATIVYEQKEKSPHDMVSPAQKEITTLEDLLKENFIPTSAVMFRNRLFGSIPAWFYRGLPGDWFLHILNAQHGKIRYFDDVMAVYRQQPEGAWSGLQPEQQVYHILDAYRLIDAHLNYEYHKTCSRYMQEFKRSLSYIYLRKFHTGARSGHLGEAARWLFRAISHDPKRIADFHQFPRILKSCVLG